MEKPDLRYLCTQMGNLSGIPFRIFRGTERLFFHAAAELPADPFLTCEAGLHVLPEHVGYIAAEDFQYYGFVRTGEETVVIGPVRQIPATDQELRALAFRTGVPGELTDSFVAGMKAIVPMPLESLLQMLCVMNYVLNGEKTELLDLAIRETEQRNLKRETESRRTEKASGAPHNTLALENTLMDFVRRGDSDGLRARLAAAPAVRGGTLAGEHLRQRKNLFIVAATLCSRAAIQGGLDSEEALSLSDQFIQSCELLPSPEAITDLQYHMLLEYAERVDQVRRGRHASPLELAVSNYLRHHLSETVTAEKIAAALYMSRPYLSERFRKETGETLTDFLLRGKTEEAKRLLRYSDRSISAIGDYLGFSSPGHFSRTFRKYAGISPKEYREMHR